MIILDSLFESPVNLKSLICVVYMINKIDFKVLQNVALSNDTDLTSQHAVYCDTLLDSIW